MNKNRGASRTLLLSLLIVFIIIVGMLIFGGCNSKTEFYSVEKDCLIVKQDSTFNCYKTYEAYAVHEGYSLDHAKQRFNAYKLEAKKKQAIQDSIKPSNTHKYPRHNTEEDYIRKRVIQRHKSQNQTQEDGR